MTIPREMEARVEHVQRHGTAKMKGFAPLPCAHSKGWLVHYGTGEIFWDQDETFGFACPEALFEAAQRKNTTEAQCRNLQVLQSVIQPHRKGAYSHVSHSPCPSESGADIETERAVRLAFQAPFLL